jgi:hypothetical protein
MVTELTLEFPRFITHIPQNKKTFIKIGYNKIHTGMHYSARAALVAAMHGYISDHIPDNLTIEGPIETHIKVYAPINFGSVKMVVDRTTGRRKIQWKPAAKDYVPNWDISNLAMVWLKCMDDVVINKGILPDDTVKYIQKTTYEFIPVETLDERKLVYELKTIKKNGLSRNRQRKPKLPKEDIN